MGVEGLGKLIMFVAIIWLLLHYKNNEKDQ